MRERLRGARGNRVVVSHGILDPNARYLGAALARGTMDPRVDELRARGVGVVRKPRPDPSRGTACRRVARQVAELDARDVRGGTDKASPSGATPGRQSMVTENANTPSARRAAMDWARIGAEIRREATRGSVIAFVAFYVLAASLFAILMAGTFSTEIYLEVAYLMMPLLFAPYAARLVTRDRERGYGAIASVNPLTRREETTARLVLLSGLVLVTLGLTGPVTALVAPPGGSAFEARALSLFLWGFFVGASSALAGLAIGTASLDRTALAVAAGAAWGFVMYVVSQSLADIADLGAGNGVLRALHLSPSVWALEATSPKLARFGAFPFGPYAGALLLLAFYAACYGLVLALQDRQGWIPRRARRSLAAPAALGLVLLLLAAGVVAAAAGRSNAPVSGRDYYEALPQKFSAGNVTLRFHTMNDLPLVDRDTGQDRFVNLTRGEHAIAVLTFHAPPGTTLALGPLSVESPTVDARATDALPATLTTDGNGTAEAKLNVSATPVILFGPYAPIAANFTVNGETVTPASFFDYGDGEEVDLENVPHWGGALAFGLVPSLAIAPLAVWLPRRLNRWP